MSSSTENNYDVFISFRGDDTRSNFTSHLHLALCQEGIETYIDDNIRKGDEVWPALSQAIKNSKVAIVVFSKNYAASTWCLKELVTILQCRKSQGQIVIPVFYEVDPSHVRKQTDSYKEAFAKHERSFFAVRDKESIIEWKAALTEAANISGWNYCSRDYKNDPQLIEKIVNDVMEKLDMRYPYELEIEGLVGIDKICEDVEFLLSKNKQNQLLENVQVIGVWGMGGIGKTTIVKAVFSQLFPQYDGVCFLANVREESKRVGLISLHDKLLFDLLKKENSKSNPIGSTLIKKRLSNKKVLIALDDVDSLDQLDTLCRECNHAGPGSKIIITTRDRHLLSGRVDEIYDVKTWSFAQSLELFSLHAFKEKCPKEGYEDLSKRAVEYAGGVPLALKVLGSDLYSRSPEFWDSELEKLRNYPNDRIQYVLQVSYDGLDSLQKQMFLDIAFFFKDEYKDDVIRILNACGFYATSGVQVLEEKALITISNSNRIKMHDLIQEMGLKIVRHEIQDPGKRSRLRDIEEVTYILKNKKGSDTIEGISLDLSHVDDILSLSADAFKKMTRLRFLKLYIPTGKRSGQVDYPRALSKISDNLRYLEWDGYGLKSLPATFCAKMLVEIRLPRSHVTELWKGVQNVVNLVRIDLCECKQLESLPDLSNASKLKWMNLSGCESLQVVHPSILSLNTLETLLLDGCKNLKSLKSGKHLRSLKKIDVNGCTSLEKFSVSSDSMESLDLRNTGIKILDSSIGRMRKLESLNLYGLGLSNLPNELSSLKQLHELRISNCQRTIDKEKLHVVFGGIKYLRQLHLKDCCYLSELPDNIGNLLSLHELNLDGCSLETLPSNVRHLQHLETLSLENCRNLLHLPELPPSVINFNAVNCRSLVTISNFMSTFGLDKEGKGKFISLENCMRLDTPSPQDIAETAVLTMMSAAFSNEETEKITLQYFSVRIYDNKWTRFCLPGSRVPEQFTFRTIHSSFDISLPSQSRCVGIIFCAVLSPNLNQGRPMKKHGGKICCECYLEDGTKVGNATTLYHEAIMELNSDHVYMWYDQFFSNSLASLVESFRQLVCLKFEFYVTDDKGEHDVFNIGIKECGLRALLVSDFPNLLQKLYPHLSSESLSLVLQHLGLESPCGETL